MNWLLLLSTGPRNGTMDLGPILGPGLHNVSGGNYGLVSEAMQLLPSHGNLLLSRS